MVMPNTGADTAQVVAERLRSLEAGSPFHVTGHSEGLQVTISLGVATTTDPMEEANDFLRRADESLYEAKNSGRNCVGSVRVKRGLLSASVNDEEPGTGTAAALAS